MSLEREKKLSLVILLCIMVAQAAALWPELYTAAGRNNDSVNHYTMTRQMVDAIEQGRNPLDFWSPEVSLGVPMVRTYQPLAHIIVAAAYFALGKSVSLMTVLVWARFLFALILPVTFYATMLLLEFSPLTAAAGALLLPMIAGPGQGAMGMEIRSWVSFGIYPQSVATNLLLPAIGLSYQAIRKGKRVALAGAVLGLTNLAHLMYGWMGAIAACGMALMPDVAPRAVRIRRTVALGAVAAVLSAFQLVPLFTDGYLINRARFEPIEKFDSYGAGQVLAWLFSGEIMDHDRLPTLSLLCFGGAALLAWRWKKNRKLQGAELFVLGSFVFWLLVFFGRSTWGILLMILGVGRDFHLHRLLAVVQIFFLMLGAIGLSYVWHEVGRRWGAAAAAILTLVLMAPMAAERMKFLNWHEGQGWDTRAEIQSKGAMLDNAIAYAKQRGGRVYAGSPTTWEQSFRVGMTSVSTFVILDVTPAVSFAYNSSVFPADVMYRFDELKPQQYRLFNIRSVLAPPVSNTPPFLTALADFGGFRVLAAPGDGYFGLVDVSAAARVNRENVNDISQPWVNSDWLDKDQYIRLDFDDKAPKDLPIVIAGGALPPLPMPQPIGSVTHEKQTGQVYEADFEALRPAHLLFRMSYHFNWKAYIDGRQQPTMMLTPGYLGVAAPVGKHHILCRYEPGNEKLVLGAIGLIATLLLIASERVWGQRLLN